MSVRAVDVVLGEKPYRVPRAETPLDLFLDGNEGALPSKELLEELQKLGPEALRRYPSAASLEAKLASRFGLEPANVLVTAGADDGIDRVCRAMLTAGRNMVIPTPTFEMVPRYAEITGAEVRRVDGGGVSFPVAAVLDAVDENTALIVVISPNNPTGVVATGEEIEQLARRCPQALILVDHAYVEFGEEDFTSRAAEFANLVVTRTFSKAWGLAGLRVGYAVGSEEVIAWLRTAGNPYPVSSLSLALAEQWLEGGAKVVEEFVARVVEERAELSAVLQELGAKVYPSQGNFVFADTGDGLWWRDGLAGQGIAVRAFPGVAGLQQAIRIACPGDDGDLQRLIGAVKTVGDPEAILFDLDGVFADVSQSYRRAIIETARTFGADVTGEEISAIKARGQANNDWRVTQELLEARNIAATLEEVTARFEALYQGTSERPGLWEKESCLIDGDYLESLLQAGLKLGIVTGRPRKDAERFLRHFQLEEYFSALVCMEDGPLKPDPAPVKKALSALGVERAWFVGDTPDDMRAGRAAGVLPLGVVAPGEDASKASRALLQAGGGRVLESLSEILDLVRVK